MDERCKASALAVAAVIREDDDTGDVDAANTAADAAAADEAAIVQAECGLTQTSLVYPSHLTDCKFTDPCTMCNACNEDTDDRSDKHRGSSSSSGHPAQKRGRGRSDRSEEPGKKSDTRQRAGTKHADEGAVAEALVDATSAGVGGTNAVTVCSNATPLVPNASTSTSDRLDITASASDWKAAR
jgi:hypothetical protein